MGDPKTDQNTLRKISLKNLKAQEKYPQIVFKDLKIFSNKFYRLKIPQNFPAAFKNPEILK